MRTILTLAVVGFFGLVPTASSEALVELQFSTPAQLDGNSTVAASGWIALFFTGSDAAGFDVVASKPFDVANYTYRDASSDFQPIVELHDIPIPPSDPTSSTAPPEFGLGFGGRAGSLIIQADEISLQTTGATGDLVAQPSGPGTLPNLVPPEILAEDRYWGATANPAGPQAALQLSAETHGRFWLEAHGIHSVQWFGADPECPEGPCPDGGGRVQMDADLVAGSASSSQSSYLVARESLGSLRGEGRAAFALVAAPALDLDIDGSTRLPLASSRPSCDGCTAVDNETLLANGTMSLHGVRLVDEGRMAATMGGDLEGLRLDEEEVDPGSLFSVVAVVGGAAAAVGVAWLLGKFAAGLLFTRELKGSLLDLPNRRLIHEAIASHPGASFRELTRITNLANGTVKHHLTALAKGGLIVEQEVRGRKAYFENHGKYATTWAAVVALRDEDLALLHRVISDASGQTQKAILARMAMHGWPRATTQRRLQRLGELGMLHTMRWGRLRVYSALSPAAPTPIAKAEVA